MVALNTHVAFLLAGLAVTQGAQPLGHRPNIVFILTDDQDRMLGRHNYTEIGSLETMPTVKSRLVEQGAWFENFFVNTPICCPSRTEFFTGRYFHNVKAAELSDTKGHPELTAEYSKSTCMHANTTDVASRSHGLFGLLTAAGYNTGLFGKITNNQKWMLDQLAGQGSVSYIDSPIDFNNYDGLPWYHFNGTSHTETLDTNHPRFGTTYQTSQLGNRSLSWLKGAMKQALEGTPFFAYLGFHAPHFPANPAPWHQHLLKDIQIPLSPNYNVSCPDKARHVRQNAPLSDLVHCWENAHFRDRWLTLLAVDDVVKALLDELEKGGALENTFVVYTSDHGYKQGQWRIGTSKQHPYETDVRVPFIVRGPGVRASSRVVGMTGNVDVLPTLLDLAGAAIPSTVDGRSMLPLFSVSSRANTMQWRDRWLNEYLSIGTYYNDHSNVWDDGTALKRCGGKMPNSPKGSVPADQCKESAGVGDGNCYFVDSTYSNSWRALRVLNETHNFQYIEYDAAWAFKEQPFQHYELYHLISDPFQLHNVYTKTPTHMQAALHAELEEYHRCKGVSCAGPTPMIRWYSEIAV